MPRQSSRKVFLERINTFALLVAERRLETIKNYDPEDVSDTEETESEDDLPVIIPCPSPITPISPISPIMSFLSDDDDPDSSKDSIALEDARYCHLLGAISALRDEVLKARVLQRIPVPMMRASQLPLLEHFADFRPH